MKANLFLCNFLEDKISEFKRLKIIPNEILYQALDVVKVLLKKLIRVGCQLGIVFGVFFYEKEELVFDFNRNFGFVN